MNFLLVFEKAEDLLEFVALLSCKNVRKINAKIASCFLDEIVSFLIASENVHLSSRLNSNLARISFLFSFFFNFQKSFLDIVVSLFFWLLPVKSGMNYNFCSLKPITDLATFQNSFLAFHDFFSVLGIKINPVRSVN